jgi:hypothetical protein
MRKAMVLESSIEKGNYTMNGRVHGYRRSLTVALYTETPIFKAF